MMDKRMDRLAGQSLAVLAGLLLTAGCVTISTIDDGIARARLEEPVRAGAVTVVPQALLEDSRCPAAVQCIRAGTVRITAAVDGQPAELALDRPVAAADGTLTLVEAYPPAREGVKRYPDEYRFGFRWTKAARE